MRRFWHWLWHDSTLDAWHCAECMEKEMRRSEEVDHVNAQMAAQKKHVNAQMAAQKKQSMDYYMKELAALRVQIEAIKTAYSEKNLTETFAAEEAEAIKVLGEDYFA